MSSLWLVGLDNGICSEIFTLILCQGTSLLDAKLDISLAYGRRFARKMSKLLSWWTDQFAAACARTAVRAGLLPPLSRGLISIFLPPTWMSVGNLSSAAFQWQSLFVENFCCLLQSIRQPTKASNKPHFRTSTKLLHVSTHYQSNTLP